MEEKFYLLKYLQGSDDTFKQDKTCEDNLAKSPVPKVCAQCGILRLMIPTAGLKDKGQEQSAGVARRGRSGRCCDR